MNDGGSCSDCAAAGEAAAGAEPRGGASNGGVSNGGASDAGEPSEATGGAAGAPVMPGPDIVLRSLSVSQSLEIELMADGVAVPPAKRALPLISGKRALLRAFVDVSERFVARSLLGVLDIESAGRAHSVVSERTITQDSTRDDLASTFVFPLAIEDLAPDTTYRVRVLETDTTPLARFPESGYAALGPQQLPPFRLVLVPFLSNGVGPRTSEAELSMLRRRLVSLYPSRDVEISVASPVSLGYAVDADGAGWDDALDLIYDLRLKAAPAHDVFYYGLLAPAGGLDAYCPDSCILGYSLVASETDADERGAIGLGVFQDGSGGNDSEETAAHELGHALGREHAPCGISDPGDIDSSWPEDAAHKNAQIGAYGYDFELGRLVKPKPAKDVMSYCTPAWVSDYTYLGIFERLQAIAAEGVALRSVQAAQALRVARIGRMGESRWLGARSKVGVVSRESAALLDASGNVVARAPARFSRVDHGRGGYVWLPEAALHAAGAKSVDLRPFGGSVLAL